jgi:hypothetical protein
MSRTKIVVSLGAAAVVSMLANLAAIETTEDTELRDLDVTGWDCADQSEGTAQSQDAKDRNRMKNRWPVNLSLFTVEPLDTARFLKKVREYDARLGSQRRGELTAAQKDHNGSADVGLTIQWSSSNRFHHPWRSTAWEVHPVIKIEVIE